MMTNKLCIITGANSGIGFETAKELARRGAFIVMVCRNEDKAEAAKQAIQRELPSAGIDIVLCDFSMQDDIHKASAEIQANYEKIDLLINNHGFVAHAYNETVEGVEETFAVNHIGYFLFTHLLMPILLKSEKARIINVASDAHRSGTFQPGNLQLKNGFSSWQAYCNSKLYNILFTLELAERLKGTGITANCLHPGVVRTNFSNGLGPIFKFFWTLGTPFMKTDREGAETTIYLATSAEVDGVNGAYFANCKVKTPKKQAMDPEAGRKLWEMSLELCDLSDKGTLKIDD